MSLSGLVDVEASKVTVNGTEPESSAGVNAATGGELASKEYCTVFTELSFHPLRTAMAFTVCGVGFGVKVKGAVNTGDAVVGVVPSVV